MATCVFTHILISFGSDGYMEIVVLDRVFDNMGDMGRDIDEEDAGEFVNETEMEENKEDEEEEEGWKRRRECGWLHYDDINNLFL